MAMDPTRQRTRAFEVYNVGYEDEATVQELGEGGGRSVRSGFGAGPRGVCDQGNLGTLAASRDSVNGNQDPLSGPLEDNPNFLTVIDPKTNSTSNFSGGFEIIDADEDEGWTPVGEVDFRQEPTSVTSKKHKSSEKKDKGKKQGSLKQLLSPKKSPKKKTLAEANIESSPRKSPKSSPKNSPKNSPIMPRSILPEILASSAVQYRPVYQTQHLGNSNLVPKPYVSRYSADRPYRAPVASPRTFLTQMEAKGEQKINENKKNEGVKVVRESKDTRGKVKKSPTTTPKETLDPVAKFDSAYLVTKPCPTRPAPSLTQPTQTTPGPTELMPTPFLESVPAKPAPSPTQPEPVPTKPAPSPPHLTPNFTQPAPDPSKPALNPTQPVPIPIHPVSGRTQHEPILEMESGDAEPSLNKYEQEITPHKDNARIPPSRRSRPNSLILTDAASPESGDPEEKPEEKITRSLSPLEDQRPLPGAYDLGQQASRALSSLATASEDTEKNEKTALYNCSNQPFNSFGELEALRSQSPQLESPPDTAFVREEPSKGEENYDINTSDFDYVDGSAEAINQLEDMLEREQTDSPPVSTEAPTLLSAASVSTLSRDSLDGFLNDDMGSLSNFVTQKTLECEAGKEPKPEERKADKEDEGRKKEESLRSMRESVDFYFEEVEDSPTHIPAEGPADDDENKGSKLSPAFTKFTQKVSDKNKENEEKSKSPSRFSPRNFLSMGNKDKNKSKSKSPTPDSSAKTEGWSTEAIEEYLVQNKKEETVRLGLMDDKDVEVHQAKKAGRISSREDLRLPEVTVHEIVTIRTDSCCKKRPAPVPPQGKSSAWKPEDIENYLLENNPDENLRLGLLSQEDIQIYEWKRATGMSPICDTSWTRETLRKNKVIRGSSSSSMSPPTSDPPSPMVPRNAEKLEVDLSDRPLTPMAEARRWSSERAVDVPATPTSLHPKPPRRRARAPLPPSPARAPVGGVSTPTRTSGHFAFRGFKIGQRVTKNVGISLLSQSITGGKEGKGDATSPAQGRRALPAPVPQPESRPESKLESEPESKPESKPRRLALEKIGVRLPGMGGKEVTTAGTPPAASTPQAGTPTFAEEESVQRRVSGDTKAAELTPVKKETTYRKLARLLGKDVSPASTPAPPVEVPAHALFLRESARRTHSYDKDPGESMIHFEKYRLFATGIVVITVRLSFSDSEGPASIVLEVTACGHVTFKCKSNWLI
ncbi:cell surface glycoprotein 1-like [Penaeus chinensis]|uniref:cell surface glycoprotein 1-like n=1 Tax=Penaeus chinensis TaxID=139456 RepID=UPI001FB64273|nr:cell surface glycoprotein 1-like [Penaeus chinensis]